MSDVPEPLLPVEPDRPSRRTLGLLLAGSAATAILVVGLVLAFRGDPAPADAPPPAPAERPAAKAPASPKSRVEGSEGGEDRQAKELFDRAEAFERAEPGEYEKRMARWREVVTTYPGSSWARTADERHRAASASLQTFLDREFESTRKDAQSLTAAGHFLDAIETIQGFKSGQTRDMLKRRADLEIAAIQNASRLAFNETAAKARDLSAKDDYAGAVALFDALAKSSIPEVATRCQAAISQLKVATEARARHLQSRGGEDARRQVREELAPAILRLVRARRYDQALEDLSAAASGPQAAAKEEIAAERAGVADASAFWEAFLKTARARTGQDAVLLLTDGRRAAGRLARVLPDRFVLETAEGPVEASFDKLHADLLVGWTLGRSLAAEDPVSYVKAALFFFCEGRDDLAKLYLATARELNGQTAASEKMFREGFLRAATALKK